MSIKVAKWTFSWSLCASRITSFWLPTLSNCQARLVCLSFFHASSAAAFASWIFIAWGIGTNLCTKFQWLIELYPLSALWSSWSFGRVGSKRFLVGFMSFHDACMLCLLDFDWIHHFRLRLPAASLSASLFPVCKSIAASIRISTLGLAFWWFLCTLHLPDRRIKRLPLFRLSIFGVSFQ